MDRQAVLLAAHERRAIREPNGPPVDGVVEPRETVGPGVEDRDPHHGAAVHVRPEAGPAVDELRARVPQRDTGHAGAGRERRLELCGRKRDGLEPVEWPAADSGRGCRHEVHGRPSRAVGAGVTAGRRYGKDRDVTCRAPAWTT